MHAINYWTYEESGGCCRLELTPWLHRELWTVEIQSPLSNLQKIFEVLPQESWTDSHNWEMSIQIHIESLDKKCLIYKEVFNSKVQNWQYCTNRIIYSWTWAHTIPTIGIRADKKWTSLYILELDISLYIKHFLS